MEQHNIIAQYLIVKGFFAESLIFNDSATDDQYFLFIIYAIRVLL